MSTDRFTGLLALLLALLTPGSVWAWGAEGHETVCQVAYLNLSGRARVQVDELLSHETDPRYTSYAKACTWADSREPVANAHRSEHYINRPRDTQIIGDDSCGAADSCLFTAIQRDSERLADASAPAAERLEALKFLSHWLGDIHQPLHVSFADDRGGNEIALTHSIGCSERLHAVWDTCIPRRVMAQRSLGGDIQCFAGQLDASLDPEERQRWQGGSPRDWADESYQIGTRAEARYCIRVGDVCQYSSSQVEYREGQPERQLDLDEAYNATFGPVVEQRLQQGGVRLAALLNRLLQ